MPNNRLAQRLGQSLQKHSIASVLLIPVLWSGQFLGSLSLAGAITLATGWMEQPLVHAAPLMDVRFDPTINQLELILPSGVTPKYTVLTAPTRIVLELPNTEVTINTTEAFPTGVVRQVRVRQGKSEPARVELEFAPDVVLRESEVQLQQIGPDNRWVMRPLLTESNFRPAPPPEADLSTPISQTSPPELSTTYGVETSMPTVYPLPNDVPPPPSLKVPLASFPNNPNSLSQPIGFIPPPVSAAAISPSGVPYQIVPFGQPLPRVPLAPGVARDQDLIGTQPVDVLLPKGTRLSLLYPGSVPLRLDPNPDRQDVLLLQGGVIDTAGNTIIPVNTPVVGHFESDNGGSQFVVEAIYMNGKTIPLAAKSEKVIGDREVSERSLLGGTGIGGLGLFILSGFSGIGLLAGAAAGAATAYATAPQPATIAPGQIVEVRLTEDFLLSSLY